jgi:phospholipid transport system substrate-binding protein
MKLLRGKVLAFVLYLMLLPFCVYAGEPTEQMKKTIDGVINVLKDEKLKAPENSGKRRRLLRQLIYRRFDFEEMSKRSLGIQWVRRSSEERREFVPLFSELLERSYINRIEKYTNEKIIYTGELVDDGYAVVKTRVISKDNINTPIDYRLLKKDSEWLIYDVIIEGVSLVNNYRTQFNRIINSDSYEGLIKRMKDKLKEEKALE